MEISKNNGLIGRVSAPDTFGSCCQGHTSVESKVAYTTGLARPATRADHSHNLLTNEYTYA